MFSPNGFILFLIAISLINEFQSGVAIRTDDGGLGMQAGDATDTGRMHIQFIRKRSVLLNGVEIDENGLLEQLDEHERQLIVGKSRTKRKVKLVQLRHVTTTATKEAMLPHTSHRVKRANRQRGAQPIQEVSVQIQDVGRQAMNLRLRPSARLIDAAFVFIRRYANSTHFVADSRELAQKYERCFYSSEYSALDLCDDEYVRGVFHHNSTDYVIHPLPERFGNSTHVILESNDKRLFGSGIFSLPTAFEKITYSNQPFEPDAVEFEENFAGKISSSETAVERALSHGGVHDQERQPQEREHLQGQQYLNISNSSSNSNSNNNSSSSSHKSTQRPFKKRLRPGYQYNNHSHHYTQHHSKQRPHHLKHLKAAPSSQQSELKHQHGRSRRHIASGGQWNVPQVLHIETAIFVDSDLFKHMAKNFPQNTESHLIRFVLAMINGVQLLYHHPSLGYRVNFVLKRLEILYKDPKDLRRSSDIDTYLSNFCMWQKSLNPASDADAVHYDHAVILTGLDLYVIGKNGKVISQVVGLAPVAGMCTPTSSCTINEGKHFESVFVVAHEIGHNLGMRHDTNENSCDPSLYIMSPTLGSGKITWSKCSRTYLNTFLETNQAKCLFDRGQFINNLDHSAEGMLPGERFDANQQCMLKYGKDSVRARSQIISDICRDLHCQRDRYTWTSHPALEGTDCGESMWCRSGVCVIRPSPTESLTAPRQMLNAAKPGYDKANFIESSKVGHLLHEHNYNKLPTWTEWGEASECDSGCLYGTSKRLLEGSTGLKTYSRRCLDFRRRCLGRDRKFESCVARQCYNIAITTIEDFATDHCRKAQKFDQELTGEGLQFQGDIEESCKVYCRTKNNGTKSRRLTFPDGTTCHSKLYNPEVVSYCISGRCEKFSCDNSTHNYYKIDAIFCQPQPQPQPVSSEVENRRLQSYNSIQTYKRYADNDTGQSGNRRVANFSSNSRQVVGIFGPTTVRNKYENEVAVRSAHVQKYEHNFRKTSDLHHVWNKHNYGLNEPSIRSASLVTGSAEAEWIVKSGCHSSCMAKSKGVQVVTSTKTGTNNIQLCTHSIKPCDRLLTPAEYAETTCSRYKLKVRGLSGHGAQIAANIDEPDRSCRVGCQDEYIKYRFYLVNGKYGHFPLGTKCSKTEERYCINGKCLEFGSDNIPLQESHISLALFRSRRGAHTGTLPHYSIPRRGSRRQKRSYLFYTPVNITETLSEDFINDIVNGILHLEKQNTADNSTSADHIEFTNPIHISTDEMNIK